MAKPNNFDQQVIEVDAFGKYLCPSSDEEYCEKQTVDFDHKAAGKMGQLGAVFEGVAAMRKIAFKSKELYEEHGK